MDRGAKINVQDHGQICAPALIAAVKNCRQVALIRLLLHHGADVSLRDVHGKTALYWALHTDERNEGVAKADRPTILALQQAGGKR